MKLQNLNENGPPCPICFCQTCGCQSVTLFSIYVPNLDPRFGQCCVKPKYVVKYEFRSLVQNFCKMLPKLNDGQQDQKIHILEE